MAPVAHAPQRRTGGFCSTPWSPCARRIIDRPTSRGSPVLRLLARHKRDREHQVWQAGSHPKRVEGEVMTRQKLEYIHRNPLNRGYPLHCR